MSDLNKIIEDLSKLTVVEAADLSKKLEEKWGVSAETPHFSSNFFERSAASTTVSFDKSSIILFKSDIEILSLYIMFFYS